MPRTIIRSRLAQTAFFRQTLIPKPSDTSLASILDNLLAQWNIDPQLHAQHTPTFALVVTLSQEERLVIDKQDEWNLFCSEHLLSKESQVTVDVELLTREEVYRRAKNLDSSSPTAEVRSTQPTPVLRSPASSNQQQKGQLERAQAPSAPKQTSEQVAKPQFAFHSVEPQAIKQPLHGTAHQSHLPSRSAEKSIDSVANKPHEAQSSSITQEARPAMSLDEIMMRSRMQGESLNQLFGSLQARSAGTPHHTTIDNDEGGPETNTGDVAPSSSEIDRPSGSATSAENNPSSTLPDAEPSSSTARDLREERSEGVQNVNNYMDNLWQERLAQMGHGPNSGSMYAKIRMGKLKGKADASAEDAPSMPSPTSSASTSSRIDAPPMTPTLSGSTMLRSPLIPLDEVNEDQVHSRQISQNIAESSPSALTPELDCDGRPFFSASLASSDARRPNSAGGPSSESRNVSLRSRLFKRRRGLSDAVRPSSLQASESVTPEGAMTPRSFNSAIFRRRPLSVRSLSDALMGTARERAQGTISDADRSAAPHELDPSAGSDTPTSRSSLRRLTHRRQASVPSLTNLMNKSRIRTSRPTTPAMVMHGAENAQEAESRPKESNDDQISLAPDAKSQMTRPSLLRNAQSSPLSATAVNLSSVGGITLHISSVGPSSFVQDDDVSRNVARRSSADDQSYGRSNGPAKPARDLFHIMLPREMQINCLRALIQLHEDEAIESRGMAARRQGKRSAMRELVRLSRVSRSWQSLILDGQLWHTLDASLAQGISEESLLRITRKAGPFIKTLNLHNMLNLTSPLFVAMTSPSSHSPAEVQSGPRVVRSKSTARLPTTMAGLTAMSVALSSLTTLNVQGCRNLSTEALHHALVRLPQLERLDASNTLAVDNNTCVILGASLPNILSLNISRCPNVSGDGVISFIDAAQGCLYDRALFTKAAEFIEAPNIALKLRELFLSGLRDVDAAMMEHIGRALRHLQTLDLSYVSDLSDDLIAAFVRHPGPKHLNDKYATHPILRPSNKYIEAPCGRFIVLTQRQAGGDLLLDDVHYRRIHPSLHHINLSSCRGVTDRIGVHLAHALPNLRRIELANIGNSLRDEGIVKLLETTPKIERIDVEGASQLGDAFLRAITPPAEYVERLGMDTRTNGARSGARNSRRSMRRARHQQSTESRAASSLAETERLVDTPHWKQVPPTGAFLSHLIVSHLSRLEADTLLALVHRCPRLMHLEVDDTRANDALLGEFVSLARVRKRQGAYVSLVDCRALSKAANSEVFSAGQARPRAGRVGAEYDSFLYEGNLSDAASPANGDAHKSDGSKRLGSSSSRLALSNGEGGAAAPNDCDEDLVVVKTFWAWQSVDQRVRAKRKAEARRAFGLSKGAAGNGKGRSARDPLASALSFIAHGRDDDDNQGRWARLASGLLGPGDDEAEDARGCQIM